MTLTDFLMVLATLLSPLIAVQVTRRLDDKNEARERKLKVYKVLMSTRAYTVSPEHVEALNSIDLEFSAKNPNEKLVAETWALYLDHLGRKDMPEEAWGVRRLDLLTDLLYEMGRCLGYDFTKVQIKNGTYSPTAHSQLQEQQGQLRAMILEVLRGQRDIPLRINKLPPNDPSQTGTHPS